jgi:hypothetical protein
MQVLKKFGYLNGRLLPVRCRFPSLEFVFRCQFTLCFDESVERVPRFNILSFGPGYRQIVSGWF